MKTLNLTLLLILLAGSAVAQSLESLNDAPGTLVLDRSWRRIERNPKLDEDPLVINDRVADQLLDQKKVAEANSASTKVKKSLRPVLTQTAASRQTMERGPWSTYIYEVKIKNTGTNIIRKLVWEYVFLDPRTLKAVGRRLYESRRKIGPGQTTKLVGSSGQPPLPIVDASQLEMTMSAKPVEQVVIQRIEYGDGSVWTRVHK